MPIDKLITNNPMAVLRLAAALDVDYQDLPGSDILKVVRDRLHQGYRLLTHPITGGILPQASPYVSVIIRQNRGVTDFESISIIEAAMATYAKLGTSRVPTDLPEAVSMDFMLIDCEMLAKMQNI